MRPNLGSMFYSTSLRSAAQAKKIRLGFTRQKPIDFPLLTAESNPMRFPNAEKMPILCKSALTSAFIKTGVLNFNRNFATLAYSPISPSGISTSRVPLEHTQLFSEDYFKKLRGLHGEFYPRFKGLLNQRDETATKTMRGEKLHFREDTKWIRDDKEWRGGETPQQLQNRRVEITGPAGDAKMVINALNSGANCFMADFEDSQSPNWEAILAGHHNLKRVHENKLSYCKYNEVGEIQNLYELNKEPATLWMRARGLHMLEKHIIDESGRPMNAMLFDLFTYIYHNIAAMRIKGEAPYVYIPKLESYEEAMLVHDMIKRIEETMAMEYGTVKVTALIETLPGLMQAEEMIFALGPYCVGLNCGRWDYLFSVIKNNAYDRDNVFPDRSLLTMDKAFLTAYMQHIVKVCHSRGIHAMGGMSAFIPTKDAQETAKVMEKVKADKQFEIDNGCDGAWVAHPGMVQPIKDLFNQALGDKPNQKEATINLDKTFQAKEFYKMTAELIGPENFTEKALRQNISVAIQYLMHWLNGQGAVAINNLMEDMATAEISRMQVWQWLYHAVQVTFADGSVEKLGNDNFEKIFDEEVAKLKKQGQQCDLASMLFYASIKNPNMEHFFQDKAYDVLNKNVAKPTPSNLAFNQIIFDKAILESLKGSRPDLEPQGSIKLTKHRGEFLNEKLATLRPDGLAPHYTFLGVLGGIQAVNVLAGGQGDVGPYAGGWQANADHEEYKNTFPDTLMVGPAAPARLAEKFNNHLHTADKVQQDKFRKKMLGIKKLPEYQQEAALKALSATLVKYYETALLADLEQGYNDPKKIAYAVSQCILHGVNVMHIEDQGPGKRCGHLGGKELAVLDDWKLIMRTANLTAQLLLGDEQIKNHYVRFVARTDALSAERIVFSEKLKDPHHPDHLFVDWKRGFSEDGKYLYLKKGKNPETGNPYGLDHSIVRAAAIVKDGLASHVWMETPDANLDVAKTFLDGVNQSLAANGLRARGLYNHSPSFMWDASYFVESQGLANKLGEYIKTSLVGMHPEKAKLKIRAFLDNKGDHIRGDYNFTEDRVEQLLNFGFDLNKTEVVWRKNILNTINYLQENFGHSKPIYRATSALQKNLDKGYQPLRDMTNVIVGQRILNFRKQLSDIGYDFHLTTLPDFHLVSFSAHELANLYREEGIHAFVRWQRRERQYAQDNASFTYINHQSATGTALEVNLNKVVGSTNTNILSGSTEAADHAKTAAMESGKVSKAGMFGQTCKRGFASTAAPTWRFH